MKTGKSIIQRNLPTDVEYELIESYYMSMENGGGEICQNCGRFITNVAIVQSKYGSFHIGMDCAATLTGIKDSFSFEYEHKARFNQAKQARTTLLKAIKNGATDLKLKTFADTNNFFKEIGSGMYDYQVSENSGAHNWKQYPALTWSKYVLPMIKEIALINA